MHWLLYDPINALAHQHSAHSESVSLLANAGKVSDTEVTDRRNSNFLVLIFGPLFTFTVCINKDFLQVIQLCGHVPSTGRHKWRHCKINNKMSVNLETPIRTFAPSGRKVSRKSRNFFQSFRRAASDVRKPAKTERQNSTQF